MKIKIKYLRDIEPIKLLECGDGDEWNFLAYAMRDTVIPKNERICQFRIIKHQPPVEIVEVDYLNNKNRGGVGSTGRL